MLCSRVERLLMYQRSFFLWLLRAISSPLLYTDKAEVVTQ